MATLSVGREEMYTQPVSAERILAIASGLLTFSKRTSKAHVRPTIYRVRALAPLALTYLSPLSTQTRTRFRQLTWVVV